MNLSDATGSASFLSAFLFAVREAPSTFGSSVVLGLIDANGSDLARLAGARDRPRVLFVTNAVLGWRTFADELARATRERNDVHAVHLQWMNDRATPHSLLHAAAHRVKARRSHAALVRARADELATMLHDEHLLDVFDVIHCSPHLAALGVVRTGWRGAVSVMFDADVRQAKHQRRGMTQPTVERAYRNLLEDEATVVRRADRLWSMSAWAAERMAGSYDVDAAAIGIVPPVRTVVPRDWSAAPPSDKARIAFVGNDLRRKGADRLIRWHHELWRDRAELHVFTTAPRPRRSTADVVWHESVPNREIVTKHLRSMDMFVMPTTSDMSPYAVSEAAAAGLPVVSSAVGAIDELVDDGRTGYLLDPSDDRAYIAAIERLFDPALRRRMGEAARAAAARHRDPDTVMHRFIDGVRDLACSHQPVARARRA
jgi:glycosyltransferase involved in cell wall biosynthesis